MTFKKCLVRKKWGDKSNYKYGVPFCLEFKYCQLLMNFNNAFGSSKKQHLQLSFYRIPAYKSALIPYPRTQTCMDL